MTPARGLLLTLWAVLACDAETEPAARAALAPDSALVRRGACPFECCMYREWRAGSQIPVRNIADAGADVVYTLEPGQLFDAVDGEVRVLDAAFVVVLDTVTTEIGTQVHFARGDTLVLLDYRGEGTWNVWHRDRVIEFVSQFWGRPGTNQKGELHGEHRTEWWVHVRTPREGWFRADSTVEFSGADACGGL